MRDGVLVAPASCAGVRSGRSRGDARARRHRPRHTDAAGARGAPVPRSRLRAVVARRTTTCAFLVRPAGIEEVWARSGRIAAVWDGAAPALALASANRCGRSGSRTACPRRCLQMLILWTFERAVSDSLPA